MAHPRVLVVLGANSQATVVETYGAFGRMPPEPPVAGARRSRPRTELYECGDRDCRRRNARLHHYRIQRESAASLIRARRTCASRRDANVTCHTFTLDGLLVRNDVNVVLDGEGAECTLNGLYVGEGPGSSTTTRRSITPSRTARAARSTRASWRIGPAAVFNGKIVVRPDAQKTDAKQTSKALLLSEEAQINTNPQLEIFANDVKCTHGAAVGQLDDEAIFYLRARGLGEADARQMLVRAFAGDVLNRDAATSRCARSLDRELFAPHAGAAVMSRAAATAAHGRSTSAPPRGLSDPRRAGARQAARLSRQRGDHAEAAGGARPAGALLPARERQRPSRRAPPERAGDRRLRSARAAP